MPLPDVDLADFVELAPLPLLDDDELTVVVVVVALVSCGYYSLVADKK